MRIKSSLKYFRWSSGDLKDTIRYRSLGFWGEVRDTYLLFSDTEVVFKAIGLNAIPKAPRRVELCVWRVYGEEEKIRTATWERDRIVRESICVIRKVTPRWDDTYKEEKAGVGKENLYLLQVWHLWKKRGMEGWDGKSFKPQLGSKRDLAWPVGTCWSNVSMRGIQCSESMLQFQYPHHAGKTLRAWTISPLCWI